MAKKKTKKKLKKDPITGKYPKRQTMQDLQRKMAKDKPYSNKKMKERAGKAWKYMKENPYEVALGVAMMHPGIRFGAGVLKAGKALKKGAQVTGAGAKKVGGTKISGAPIRKALGTKVKGQGKTYKTRAQAEVAAGGTTKMKGATIDRTKKGFEVNPSRGNIMKSPKTFTVGAVTLAEIQRRRNKAAKAKDVEGGGLTKKKKKTKKKNGTTVKRKTYKSVESNYTRKRDDRGTRVTTSTPRANQRRKTVKKKAKTKKKLHGSEIFRRRLSGRRGY